MTRPSLGRTFLLSCILLFAPLLIGPALADTPATGKRPLTVEDLWQVKRVGKPALSPDG